MQYYAMQNLLLSDMTIAPRQIMIFPVGVRKAVCSSFPLDVSIYYRCIIYDVQLIYYGGQSKSCTGIPAIMPAANLSDCYKYYMLFLLRVSEKWRAGRVVLKKRH